MTPEEIQKIITKAITEYMKNVDNLHVIENYLVNQNSFLDQIAGSLIRNGDFIEELSQGIAANLTPIISDSIKTHENDCTVKKEIKEYIKESKENKKDISKVVVSWIWEVFKYLIQIIIILTGLVLATGGFKK